MDTSRFMKILFIISSIILVYTFGIVKGGLIVICDSLLYLIITLIQWKIISLKGYIFWINFPIWAIAAWLVFIINDYIIKYV
jgi:hypothetical protein